MLISSTVHNDLYQDITECEIALFLKAYIVNDYDFVDNGVLERQCMLLSNVIMNKVFYGSFDYSMKIRLTYLNLEDFELDERNVKMLKFFNLKTLILSGCSIKGDFFLYLPVYLKTLKLRSTPIIDDVWFRDDKSLCFTMKGFRSHQNLKSLVLNDRFLRVGSLFNNLPVHLELLEFVLCVKDVRLKLVRNFTKICLKSFTVKLIQDYDVKSPIEDSMKRDEIRISSFSQFAGFIEFEKLVELKFEVDGEVMVLDTESYEIK
ncbi:putative LRR containing protein [Trachipleistophora hominis]|uniref:Putative LRR containing protein n=1 Tax=Trachipleistophora hominis TaxID=72359 RepID=L7K0L9_TRAHO|nr:putative LRR containing protein [Trachipleistophora hominis]